MMRTRERLLLATLLMAASSSTSAATRPNIVFIVADDLGWTDLGSFGSGYYQTPHIDQLAATGMKFTSAYANPNCAPTRASLLTGRYTPRHGVMTVGSPERGSAEFRKLTPPKNTTELSPDEITFAEVLHDAGYVTAHMGKWHMGTGRYAPEAHGFDINIAGNGAGHPESYFSPYENPDLKDGRDGEYLTDRLTEEAVAFIESQSDERPFLLYLAYFTVHTPIQPRPDRAAKYGSRPAVGGHGNPSYAGMVDALDAGVSRVLEAVEASATSENTVVLFVSDNGGLGGYDMAGGKNFTDNAPLRGGKGMLYEGGVRVPLIVRWPGVTLPGSVSDEPVICVDLFSTVIDIAGLDPPTDRPIDGISILALLNGAKTLNRDAIYWHFPAYLEANRDGSTWRTTPAGAVRVGRYKLIEFFESGTVELYDLETDISETHDLAASSPELTARIHQKLEAWRKTMNAPMPELRNP